MAEKSGKLKVRIPTFIVRNDGITLSNGEFLLYTRLSFLYFRNYQQEEMLIDHKKLMLQIEITDTRTLKKYLKKLYKHKLIKNKIDRFSRKGETTIIFNGEVFNNTQKEKDTKLKHFTMMSADIFNYIEHIGENGFRLVWYYKSHINTNDTNRDRSYCFVGIRTLKENLKMGSTTIKEANEKLVEKKLIKIEQFKAEVIENENDEFIYDRYNSHYYVNNKLF